MLKSLLVRVQSRAPDNLIMKTHLLQSPYWEKFAEAEGKQTLRIDGAGFAALAVVEETPLGKYLSCPYGPTVEGADKLARLANLRTALQDLTKLAREQGAFFVRIEPTIPVTELNNGSSAQAAEAAADSLTYHDLRALGLKKSHDIDPAHTWVLDLTQPEEQIFAEMEKEKGRLWRNHHKKNLTIRQTNDPEQVPILMELLEKVGNQNHFIPQDEAHLKNQVKSGFATLYIAELTSTGENAPQAENAFSGKNCKLERIPIAAALAHDDDNTRYYAHAAADFEHRKLAAGAIILVQMIVDAKAKGLEKFDFWGVTDSEDKNHPWYGFTQFKKSFGGQQVDYAGTWDLPLDKMRYTLYKVMRWANRLVRKIKH